MKNSKSAFPGNAEDAQVKAWSTAWRYGRAIVYVLLAGYFFFIPGLLIISAVHDPAVSGAGMPRIAWRVHRHLAPLYERWARQRIASGAAAHLQLHDVPSTEWPMFGSVFYLLATEALQDAWEHDPSLAPKANALREFQPPKRYSSASFLRSAMFRTVISSMMATSFR